MTTRENNFLKAFILAAAGIALFGTVAFGETFTPNLGLSKPGFGEYNNAWQTPVNANMDVLDQCVVHTGTPLTSGRVPYVTTDGELKDESGFTYDEGTSTLSVENLDLTTPLTETKGGTGLSAFTLGDVIYSDGTDSLAKLSGNTTTTTKFLSQTGDGAASAAPAWGALTDGDVPAALTRDTEWDTAAEINAATTDDDFATLTGTETLSGKTLASPILTTKYNPPSVTAFPGSPATGDTVVVTDDSAIGECDSAAGSAVTHCRYDGSAWTALGDGGGGGGGSFQLIGGTGTTSLSDSVTQYFPISGHFAPSGTEGGVALRVNQQDATVANLHCRLNTVPGSGKSYAFTVMYAASATALTCTISGAAGVMCTDAVNSFTQTAASADISVRSVPSGTPAAAPARCSVTITP